jgi:hypothetical protein
MMARVVLQRLFGDPLPSRYVAKAMLVQQVAAGSRSAISVCPLVGLRLKVGRSSMAEQALLVPITLLALLIALAALLRN